MSSQWQEAKTSIKSLINPINLPPLIIIAGGKSSRMGYPKGLLEYQNRHLIMLILDVYRRAGGKKAVIVLGFEIKKYFEELSFLKGLEPPCQINLGSLKLLVVTNPNPSNGQFSSIQTGILALENELEQGVLYHSVDRFPNSMNAWHHLANFFNNDAVFYEKDGVKSQPVWLSRKIALNILKQDARDARLDNIMNEVGLSIPYENDEHNFNINTLSDWEEAKAFMPNASPLKLEIKGVKRSGKTSFLRNIIKEISDNGFKVGGILQPSLDSNFDSAGYDIENIATGEKFPLARRRATPNANGLWFDFNDDAFDYAKEIILDARKNADILVVDEIGKLEQKGLGHSLALNEKILSESAFLWLLGVRI